MEKLLVMEVMEDLIQKQISVSLAIIRTEARSLFQVLKLKEGEGYDQTFTANSARIQRFRKRVNFQNVKICGGAVSAENKAAKLFKGTNF